MEWNYFFLNGPHYFLTVFYFLRVLSLPIGILGFVAVAKQSINLATHYYYATLFEVCVFPMTGFLASYDMCNSYVYYEPCKDIIL
jgi:hypothetical protein